MAQIKIKRSSVSGKVPLTSDLVLGEFAVNTYDGIVYIKKNVDGAESIVPVGGTSTDTPTELQNRYRYTATSGQTTFSAVYTAPYVDVYQNGVKLGEEDYTATNGTSVVLVEAAIEDDLVEIIGHTVYNVANVQPALVSGTNIKTINGQSVLGSGNITISGGTGGTVDLSAVAQSIVPSDDITYDLGSSAKRWRDLYLSGSTINLGGAVIKSDATSGAIALLPKPTLEEPNPSGIVVSPTGGISTVVSTGGEISTENFAAAVTQATSVGASGGANNLIINPEFTINQRSAASPVATANAYNYDRWYYDGTYLYQGIENINLRNSTYSISWVGDVTCSYSLNSEASTSQNTQTYTSIDNGGQIVITDLSSNNLWVRFSAQPTWVKLEHGVSATPFNYRDYTTEVNLCYRYYEKTTAFTFTKSSIYDSNVAGYWFYFKQVKRVNPTMSGPSMSWPRITAFLAVGSRSSHVDAGTVTATAEL